MQYTYTELRELNGKPEYFSKHNQQMRKVPVESYLVPDGLYSRSEWKRRGVNIEFNAEPEAYLTYHHGSGIGYRSVELFRHSVDADLTIYEIR